MEAYVCVEYLKLSEHGVRQEHARGRLAHEPVSLYHFDGRAVEGVGIDGCTNDGETGNDSQSRSERTAEDET